jgi:hypothetical protein
MVFTLGLVSLCAAGDDVGPKGGLALYRKCGLAKSIRKSVFLTTGVFLSESDPDHLVLIWSLGF